jgi:hypothetical protein
MDLIVLFSGMSSFLLTVQFHYALLAAQEVQSNNCFRKELTIYFAFTLYAVHTIAFWISTYSFASGVAKVGVFDVGALSSGLFFIYKIFISLYFFWGNFKVYRIFQQAGTATANSPANRIGRRLGRISVYNLATIILAGLWAANPVSQHGNGWVLLYCIPFTINITALAEIGAVTIPLNESTQKQAAPVNRSCRSVLEWLKEETFFWRNVSNHSSAAGGSKNVEFQ